MMTDPIADLLIRIQNATRRGHETVTVPASKLKAEVLRILKAEGFISEYERVIADGHPTLRIRLRYLEEGQSIITGMRRISKPGLRHYVGANDIPRVLGGLGVAVISTPEGVMSGTQARKKNLGGEVVCHVW